MDHLGTHSLQNRTTALHITVGWTRSRTCQWCELHQNLRLLSKDFVSRRETLVHDPLSTSSMPISLRMRTSLFTMVDRLFSQNGKFITIEKSRTELLLGTARWKCSKKSSINRLVLISYRFGSANSCVWRKWMNNSKSRNGCSRTILMCSFRLRASHLTDQINKEQLQFTNTEVATQPRISVRGLWIFKFVQRTYKKDCFFFHWSFAWSIQIRGRCFWVKHIKRNTFTIWTHERRSRRCQPMHLMSLLQSIGLHSFRSLSFSSRRCLDRCWNTASTGSSTIPLARCKSPVLSTSFRRKIASSSLSNNAPTIDCWANDFCCIGFLFLVIIHEFCLFDVSCVSGSIVYIFVLLITTARERIPVRLLFSILFCFILCVCVRVSSNRFLIQKVLSECVRDERNLIDRFVLWSELDSRLIFRLNKISSDICRSILTSLNLCSLILLQRILFVQDRNQLLRKRREYPCRFFYLQ